MSSESRFLAGVNLDIRKHKRSPRSSAHLGLHPRRPAAQDFEEAVDLVRVPAEAGQQEVEVGQPGDLVVTYLVASSVGQEGDGLSRWAQLRKKNRECLGSWRLLKDSEKGKLFVGHLSGEDVQAVSQAL